MQQPVIQPIIKSQEQNNQDSSQEPNNQDLIMNIINHKATYLSSSPTNFSTVNDLMEEVEVEVERSNDT